MLATIYFKDLTSEGQGIFTLSLCWGEFWAKSMSHLKMDLVHDFGDDYSLVDIDSLSDEKYSELEALHAGN
ncbi:hypothetical protein ACRWQL_01100 [Shewanella sp. HL-SH4]|uniref:hypothetical protein n=1 Tax=Shewanella sp. HL-SH4 TaxID=3436240 RepID=UPI003EB6B7A6